MGWFGRTVISSPAQDLVPSPGVHSQSAVAVGIHILFVSSTTRKGELFLSCLKRKPEIKDGIFLPALETRDGHSGNVTLVLFNLADFINLLPRKRCCNCFRFDGFPAVQHLLLVSPAFFGYST